MFTAGLVLYTVAGFATTFATSLGAMLIGRFLWGAWSSGTADRAQALLRDRSRGDELARAMAIILKVFPIVPTLAPIVGRIVLRLGSWRYTCAVGPSSGCSSACGRRDSTSRSIRTTGARSVRSLAVTVVSILRTRRTLGNAVALMIMSATFLPYLGSSERMYGEIYGRADTFFIWFAMSAVVMVGFTLVSARLVRLWGSARTTTVIFVLLSMAAAVNLAVTLGSDGVPPFAFFVGATTLVIALETALTPPLTSGALEEAGHVAGTAASVIGVISLLGGALLSPVVNTAIGSTVKPFAAGFLVFSLIAVGVG